MQDSGSRRSNINQTQITHTAQSIIEGPETLNRQHSTSIRLNKL